MWKKLIYGIFVTLLCLNISVSADFKKNHPVTITDADGNIKELFVTGDEYVQVFHDADGYVMVKTQQGYFEYATIENNTLVGCGMERTLTYQDIPPEYFEAEREKIFSVLEEEGVIIPGHSAELFSDGESVKEFKGEGTVIVVPVAFSGGNMDFNGFTQTVENACKYYKEVSYGELSLGYLDVSEGLDIFVSPNSEKYYQPYDASNTDGYQGEKQRLIRENELVSAAISYYGLNGKATDAPMDVDGDGANDFLVFVYNTKYDTVWNSLLWPHQIRYDSVMYNIFGKQVKGWIFVPRSGSDTVLCHEMYHAIGAPDLYDYNNIYDYIGMWDIMDSGNGTMLAYMKYRYGGWIDEIPEIIGAGTYTLNPACDTENNCYKIPINDNEYYVLEYRNRYSGKINYLDFWRQWHNEGLLITRVDSRYSGEGNMYSANVENEVNLVKHPAMGLNSVLGAVLPEFSPDSGFDRSLQSGGTDDRTVIKNIRENADGTLSFDVSFDGVSSQGYATLDSVEILPQLLQDSAGNVYCRLTANKVTPNDEGTKSYEVIEGVYDIHYIFLTGKETSANSYEYVKYSGPFKVSRSGILWAYLTDADGNRVGMPCYTYLHYSLPGINTSRNIKKRKYDTSVMFSQPHNKMVSITFAGGEKYVGKLNMDRLVKFTVDGVEYEYLSEDIRGKTLSFAADVVNVDADDGSEVYMQGMSFQNFDDKKRVLFECTNGRRSLFENAGSITKDGTIKLSVLGDFEGEIRYTTDGTEPDSEDMLYTDAIDIDTDTVITAGTFVNGELAKANAFNVYVQEDYREYSADELNKIFKNSGSGFAGGEGKYLKIAYTSGEGTLILRDENWIEVEKLVNPRESGVIYLDAEKEIFVQEAVGDIFAVSVVDNKYQVDMTILEDDASRELVIQNFGDDLNFELILAEFSEDRLEIAENSNVFIDAGETKYLPLDTVGTIKAFAFKSLSDMEPLGIAVSR